MPPEIQDYIISLAESQLAHERDLEREIRMTEWLCRPKPVPFKPKPIMLDTLPIIFSDYDSFDYRATGIGYPMKSRPISFTFESPSLSSRDVNLNRGETFAKRYEPLLRSKQNGD